MRVTKLGQISSSFLFRTQECASPRGSGVCYLRKVAGACEGHYNEWYYDMDGKRCSQFVYSGCLGNGNRQ